MVVHYRARATVIGDKVYLLVVCTKALGHSSIVIGGDDADRDDKLREPFIPILIQVKATVGTVSAAVKALTGYEELNGVIIIMLQQTILVSRVRFTKGTIW